MRYQAVGTIQANILNTVKNELKSNYNPKSHSDMQHYS